MDSGFGQAATDILPSRRIPDVLSIAATGLLDRWFQTRSTTYIPVGVPSRRIPDILSINHVGAEVRHVSGTAEGRSG